MGNHFLVFRGIVVPTSATEFCLVCFKHEDGGTTSHRNVRNYLPSHTKLHIRRLETFPRRYWIPLFIVTDWNITSFYANFMPLLSSTALQAGRFAGSISCGVIGNVYWLNPSGRTTILGSSKTLTEMSTRVVSWGLQRPVPGTDNLAPFMCHCPEILGAPNSWSPQASPGLYWDNFTVIIIIMLLLLLLFHRKDWTWGLRRSISSICLRLLILY